MKNYLLLFATFIALSVAGQTPCSITELGPLMGTSNSEARINLYAKLKIKALPAGTDRTTISVTVPALIDLLAKINDVPDCNGVRAYFAVDLTPGAAEAGKMTVIFVATTSQPEGNVDNLKYCFVLKENAPVATSLSSDEASKWVSNFQDGENSKYSQFNRDGVVYNSGKSYTETKSLWYDIKTFTDQPGGLLYYLRCPDTHFKSANITFGAFGIITENKNYEYHLTILFCFERDKVPAEEKDIRLSFTQKRNGFAKSGIEPRDLFNSSDYVDTGVPCPPYPDSSNKCPGSSLPLE